MAPRPQTTVLSLALRVASARHAGGRLLVGGLALSPFACAPVARTTTASRTALDRWEDPQRERWSQPDRVVAQLVSDRQALDIVDLGAGSGYFSRRLAKQNPHGRVLALEVNSEFRSYIEKHRLEWGTPNLETRLVINNNPLLREASIDLVFMSNTYRYLKERASYMQDLGQSLRPGGTIAIIDFRAQTDCGEIPECPPARERIAREQVLAEMTSAGFRLREAHDFLPHQYFLEFEREGDATPSPNQPASEGDGDGSHR